jgi:hypothetical protein
MFFVYPAARLGLDSMREFLAGYRFDPGRLHLTSNGRSIRVESCLDSAVFPMTRAPGWLTGAPRPSDSFLRHGREFGMVSPELRRGLGARQGRNNAPRGFECASGTLQRPALPRCFGSSRSLPAQARHGNSS